MKLINYVVVHISVLLALGILSAHFLSSHEFFYFKINFGLTLLLVIGWIMTRRGLSQNAFFGILAYLCIFGIGYFNYQLRLPKFQPKHYSHFSSQEFSSLLQLKVINVLKPDTYNNKYIVTVQAMSGRLTIGKILLNVQKDTRSYPLEIDNVILVSSKSKVIPKPLNPDQFDYSKYMLSLGVYHQIHISKDHILKKTKGEVTLVGRTQKFRNNLIKKLKSTNIKTNERAIIQALVLGQKKDISKELYSDYAAAGAVHILAVSGLHVGILFIIFSSLFKPLLRIRYGPYIRNVLVVFCLWCFAFIAGLSPSVTRAVVMFSFLIFAKTINRQTSTINNLFLSFFFLLVCNPLWLFQVGFQLSYLAVFSILLIQPRINIFYRPRFYLDKLFWDICTVSFAAQIGILPLSLYYFHQFPGLFFLTNIVVLPVLGILLGGGLFIVLLAGLELLPNWLAMSYNYLIELLNGFIVWVANKESFLFQDIHFAELKVLGSYLLLTFIVLLLHKYSFKKFIFASISFCLLLIIFIFNKHETAENSLVIFHKNRTSLIGYKQAQNLILLHHDSVLFNKNNYPLKGYGIANRIKSYSYENMPRVFRFRNKLILIIDSLGVFPQYSKIDVLVLTQSPKVHLKRVLDSLQPSLVIADGSNYSSYVSLWEKTCKQKKLPFYHTGTKGALIIE